MIASPREELLLPEVQRRYDAGRRDFPGVLIRQLDPEDPGWEEHPSERICLAGADLSGALMYGIELAGADLSRANLAGAHLEAAYLHRADLTDAKLAGANLRGAWLDEANLQRADLSTTDLGPVIREERDELDPVVRNRTYYPSSLRSASLTGVRACRTLFESADLRGARLDGIDAREARFIDADLRGTGVDPSMLHEAATVEGARFGELQYEGAEHLPPLSWDEAREMAEATVRQPYKAKKRAAGSDRYAVINVDSGWQDDVWLPRSLAIEDAQKMNGDLIGAEMLRLVRERNEAIDRAIARRDYGPSENDLPEPSPF